MSAVCQLNPLAKSGEIAVFTELLQPENEKDMIFIDVPLFVHYNGKRLIDGVRKKKGW